MAQGDDLLILKLGFPDSVGLPSLLKYPPGILPAANAFSWIIYSQR